MEDLQATKVWVSICSILIFTGAVSACNGFQSPYIQTSNTPWWTNSQNTPIIRPDQNNSKMSCISANPNILNILQESKEHCQGQDYRVTFYLQTEDNYIKLESVFVDKHLFHNVLMKYSDWSLTSEKLDEMNLKQAMKDDYQFLQNIENSSQIPRHNKWSNSFELTENNNINRPKITSYISDGFNHQESTTTGHNNLDNNQDTIYKNNEECPTIIPIYNPKYKQYEISIPQYTDTSSIPRTINVYLDTSSNSHEYLRNDKKDNKENMDLDIYNEERIKNIPEDQHVLLEGYVKDYKISDIIDILLDKNNLRENNPVLFDCSGKDTDIVNSHVLHAFSNGDTIEFQKDVDDNLKNIDSDQTIFDSYYENLNKEPHIIDTIDTGYNYNLEYNNTDATDNGAESFLVRAETDGVKYCYYNLPKDVRSQVLEPTKGEETILNSVPESSNTSSYLIHSNTQSILSPKTFELSINPISSNTKESIFFIGPYDDKGENVQYLQVENLTETQEPFYSPDKIPFLYTPKEYSIPPQTGQYNQPIPAKDTNSYSDVKITDIHSITSNNEADPKDISHGGITQLEPGYSKPSSDINLVQITTNVNKPAVTSETGIPVSELTEIPQSVAYLRSSHIPYESQLSPELSVTKLAPILELKQNYQSLDNMPSSVTTTSNPPIDTTYALKPVIKMSQLYIAPQEDVSLPDFISPPPSDINLHLPVVIDKDRQAAETSLKFTTTPLTHKKINMEAINTAVPTYINPFHSSYSSLVKSPSQIPLKIESSPDSNLNNYKSSPISASSKSNIPTSSSVTKAIPTVSPLLTPNILTPRPLSQPKFTPLSTANPQVEMYTKIPNVLPETISRTSKDPYMLYRLPVSESKPAKHVSDLKQYTNLFPPYRSTPYNDLPFTAPIQMKSPLNSILLSDLPPEVSLPSLVTFSDTVSPINYKNEIAENTTFQSGAQPIPNKTPGFKYIQSTGSPLATIFYSSPESKTSTHKSSPYNLKSKISTTWQSPSKITNIAPQPSISSDQSDNDLKYLKLSKIVTEPLSTGQLLTYTSLPLKTEFKAPQIPKPITSSMITLIKDEPVTYSPKPNDYKLDFKKIPFYVPRATDFLAPVTKKITTLSDSTTESVASDKSQQQLPITEPLSIGNIVSNVMPYTAQSSKTYVETNKINQSTEGDLPTSSSPISVPILKEVFPVIAPSSMFKYPTLTNTSPFSTIKMMAPSPSTSQKLETPYTFELKTILSNTDKGNKFKQTPLVPISYPNSVESLTAPYLTHIQELKTYTPYTTLAKHDETMLPSVVPLSIPSPTKTFLEAGIPVTNKNISVQSLSGSPLIPLANKYPTPSLVNEISPLKITPAFGPLSTVSGTIPIGLKQLPIEPVIASSPVSDFKELFQPKLMSMPPVQSLSSSPPISVTNGIPTPSLYKEMTPSKLTPPLGSLSTVCGTIPIKVKQSPIVPVIAPSPVSDFKDLFQPKLMSMPPGQSLSSSPLISLTNEYPTPSLINEITPLKPTPALGPLSTVSGTIPIEVKQSPIEPVIASSPVSDFKELFQPKLMSIPPVQSLSSSPPISVTNGIPTPSLYKEMTPSKLTPPLGSLSTVCGTIPIKVKQSPIVPVIAPSPVSDFKDLFQPKLMSMPPGQSLSSSPLISLTNEYPTPSLINEITPLKPTPALGPLSTVSGTIPIEVKQSPIEPVIASSPVSDFKELFQPKLMSIPPVQSLSSSPPISVTNGIPTPSLYKEMTPLKLTPPLGSLSTVCGTIPIKVKQSPIVPVIAPSPVSDFKDLFQPKLMSMPPGQSLSSSPPISQTNEYPTPSLINEITPLKLTPALGSLSTVPGTIPIEVKQSPIEAVIASSPVSDFKELFQPKVMSMPPVQSLSSYPPFSVTNGFPTSSLYKEMTPLKLTPAFGSLSTVSGTIPIEVKQSPMEPVIASSPVSDLKELFQPKLMSIPPVQALSSSPPISLTNGYPTPSLINEITPLKSTPALGPLSTVSGTIPIEVKQSPIEPVIASSPVSDFKELFQPKLMSMPPVQSLSSYPPFSVTNGFPTSSLYKEMTPLKLTPAFGSLSTVSGTIPIEVKQSPMEPVIASSPVSDLKELFQPKLMSIPPVQALSSSPPISLTNGYPTPFLYKEMTPLKLTPPLGSLSTVCGTIPIEVKQSPIVPVIATPAVSYFKEFVQPKLMSTPPVQSLSSSPSISLSNGYPRPSLGNQITPLNLTSELALLSTVSGTLPVEVKQSSIMPVIATSPVTDFIEFVQPKLMSMPPALMPAAHTTKISNEVNLNTIFPSKWSEYLSPCNEILPLSQAITPVIKEEFPSLPAVNTISPHITSLQTVLPQNTPMQPATLLTTPYLHKANSLTSANTFQAHLWPNTIKYIQGEKPNFVTPLSYPSQQIHHDIAQILPFERSHIEEFLPHNIGVATNSLWPVPYHRLSENVISNLTPLENICSSVTPNLLLHQNSPEEQIIPTSKPRAYSVPLLPVNYSPELGQETIQGIPISHLTSAKLPPLIPAGKSQQLRRPYMQAAIPKSIYPEPSSLQSNLYPLEPIPKNVQSLTLNNIGSLNRAPHSLYTQSPISSKQFVTASTGRLGDFTAPALSSNLETLPTHLSIMPESPNETVKPLIKAPDVDYEKYTPVNYYPNILSKPSTYPDSKIAKPVPEPSPLTYTSFIDPDTSVPILPTSSSLQSAIPLVYPQKFISPLRPVSSRLPIHTTVGPSPSFEAIPILHSHYIPVSTPITASMSNITSTVQSPFSKYDDQLFKTVYPVNQNIKLPPKLLSNFKAASTPLWYQLPSSSPISSLQPSKISPKTAEELSSVFSFPYTTSQAVVTPLKSIAEPFKLESYKYSSPIGYAPIGIVRSSSSSKLPGNIPYLKQSTLPLLTAQHEPFMEYMSPYNMSPLIVPDMNTLSLSPIKYVPQSPTIPFTTISSSATTAMQQPWGFTKNIVPKSPLLLSKLSGDVDFDIDISTPPITLQSNGYSDINEVVSTAKNVSVSSSEPLMSIFSPSKSFSKDYTIPPLISSPKQPSGYLTSYTAIDQKEASYINTESNIPLSKYKYLSHLSPTNTWNYNDPLTQFNSNDLTSTYSLSKINTNLSPFTSYQQPSDLMLSTPATNFDSPLTKSKNIPKMSKLLYSLSQPPASVSEILSTPSIYINQLSTPDYSTIQSSLTSSSLLKPIYSKSTLSQYSPIICELVKPIKSIPNISLYSPLPSTYEKKLSTSSIYPLPLSPVPSFAAEQPLISSKSFSPMFTSQSQFSPYSPSFMEDKNVPLTFSKPTTQYLPVIEPNTQDLRPPYSPINPLETLSQPLINSVYGSLPQSNQELSSPKHNMVQTLLESNPVNTVTGTPLPSTSRNQLMYEQPSPNKSKSNKYNPNIDKSVDSATHYYNDNDNVCNPIYKSNLESLSYNAVNYPTRITSKWEEISPPILDTNYIKDSSLGNYPLQPNQKYVTSKPILQPLQYQSYNSNLDMLSKNINYILLQNEMRTSLSNFVNSDKNIKSNFYNSNLDTSIPLGNILVAKTDSTNPAVHAISPLIHLKMWPSNLKLLEAKLELRFKDVSLTNFQPVINNLNVYDLNEVVNLVKNYIRNKYGDVIVVDNKYLNNAYEVIKNCDNPSDKYNMLWPVDTSCHCRKPILNYNAIR